MTARVTRAILRHDAVTDAALWARLRDGSLTLAGNWRLKIYGRLGCPAGRRMHRGSRVFFADATAAEAAGYRPCALLPGRIRCLEIGGEFRHTGDVVP